LKEECVGRIIRFEPGRQPSDVPWGRFPRFEEVGAQIDAQAAKLFDSAASLERGSELYARLEARLGPQDRPLLRELYEAISSHHERFEHAAYLVGLRAGSGKLEGLPPALPDERADRDEPEPA
jgi:hypothetical protein